MHDMKTRLVLSLLAALVSGAASAADLPTAKGPPPAPVAYVPAFTWTGFYVGVNAGGAWHGSNNWDWYPSGYTAYGGPIAFPGSVTGWSYPAVAGSGGNRNGWLGGATAGYNYQMGSFVIGVEGDLDYLSSNNNNGAIRADCLYENGCDPRFAGTYLGTLNRSSNHYFGTLRARAGFAVDRALIYATGGLAFGGSNGGHSGSLSYWQELLTCPDGPGACVGGGRPITSGPADATLAFSGNNSNNIGWTVGAGAEYAFTDNWTAKIEYLYVQDTAKSHNGSVASCTGNACTVWTGANAYWLPSNGSNQNMNIVRAGLNYKF
jgi:outer membrane immunogenic protein